MLAAHLLAVHEDVVERDGAAADVTFLTQCFTVVFRVERGVEVAEACTVTAHVHSQKRARTLMRAHYYGSRSVAEQDARAYTNSQSFDLADTSVTYVTPKLSYLHRINNLLDH